MDKKLKVGDRVEIVKSIGVCQFEKIEKGEKGTVKEVNDHGDPLYMIDLDTLHEELEPWDNELQIFEHQEPKPHILRKIDSSD